MPLESDARLRFHVAGEDELHRAMAMALTNRTIRELAAAKGADWLDADAVRRWSALDEADAVPEPRRYYDTHQEPRRRVHGHLNGRPALRGAAKLRNIIVEHAQAEPQPDLLVVLQDTDGDPEVAAGAEQILDWVATRHDLPVVAIGCPHQDAEAWLFGAPGTAEEVSRAAAAKRILGFDPFAAPERLTAHPNTAPTDAKRVARFVLLQDGDVLAVGKPKSASPEAEDCDRLAESLSTRQAAAGDGTGISTFLHSLRVALGRVLRDHLP